MEQLLYLNRFTAIIAQNDEYIFEVNGNFDLSNNRYHLNDLQKEQLKQMVDGKGFKKDDLLTVWGEDIINNFISNNILISEEIDINCFESRTDAYFQFQNISNSSKKLAQKKVMIIGCGSIGTHVAWNLTAMGVGKLILVDFDKVEESNLNRQLLFDIDDIGDYKVSVLQKKLSKINRNVSIIAENVNVVTEDQLEELCINYNCDLIIKSADTPEQFPVWLDSVCKRNKFKYISGTMTGTFFAVGPTYMGDEDSFGYSNFFPQSTDFRIVAGRRPSLSCQCSYVSALLAAEASRILLGIKKYTYVNKICFEDPIQTTKMDAIAADALIESEEEYKFNLNKNVLILSLVILIFNALLHYNFLFLVGTVIIMIGAVAIYSVPSKAVSAVTSNAILYFLVGFIIIVISNGLVGLKHGVAQSLLTILYIFIMYSLFILTEAILVFLLSSLKRKVGFFMKNRLNNRRNRIHAEYDRG